MQRPTGLIISALISCLFFLSFPFIATAKTLSVPSQYRTIQGAINSAKSGDVILVAAGRYKENIKLKDGIILRGEGADTTMIDGRKKGNVVEGARGAVIEGFTITNSGTQGKTGTMMNVGISAHHSPMTIANCRIIGNNTGIRTYFSPSNIVNNVIASNKGYGLYILYSDSSIKNNIIRNNESYGIYNSYSNPEIINNTILSNFDGIYSEISRVVVRNNIISGNKNAGIHWVEFPANQDEKTAAILSSNLLWKNKQDYINVSMAKGDILEDPGLVSIEKRDFRLKKGSPAIDSGNESKDDNDNDGSRNDMGAYGGPLALNNIPSPTSKITFAKLKINLEKLAEPDYSSQATWAEGSSSGMGNFQSYCTTCHGSAGKGDGPVGETLDIKPRDLSNADYMKNLSDDHLFQVIKHGGASVGLSENMIPVGLDLSDEDIRNVITYIRSDICKCRYSGN